jgi:hypothetical protein
MQTLAEKQRKKLALLLEKGSLKPEEVEQCGEEQDVDNNSMSVDMEGIALFDEDETEKYTKAEESISPPSNSNEVYLRVFDGTLVSFERLSMRISLIC